VPATRPYPEGCHVCTQPQSKRADRAGRHRAAAGAALLIAGVGASLLTMTVAAARITQLRRRIRQHS
jgi:hypothetical protein